MAIPHDDDRDARCLVSGSSLPLMMAARPKHPMGVEALGAQTCNNRIYRDAITGIILNPDLVEQARQLELDYFKELVKKLQDVLGVEGEV